MKISIIELVKKIPRFSGYLLQMIFYYIVSIFYKDREKYKDAWLICERGTEARDNGYWMFKYIREKHPEQKVYYIINKKNKIDYEKVKKLGEVIEYNSFQHKIALILSNVYISTHIGYINIWSYLLYKKVFDRKNKKKYIFLQHGVTKDDMSDLLNKRINQINLFITSTFDERNSILNNPNYGYKEEEVPLIGMARFDNLNNYQTKEQILLMPTWRSYLVNPSYKKEDKSVEKGFTETEYYKKYKSLLNNTRLHELLKNYNVKLVFYPHYEMQKYIKLFNTNNPNIIIASKEENDVQELLRQSKILITDYSSVYFDFAYMKKPELFYQFDKEKFRQKQYKECTIEYKHKEFGRIAKKEDEVIEEVEKILKNGCKMEEKYIEMVEDTFAYIDNNNCKRTYEEIIKLLNY